MANKKNKVCCPEHEKILQLQRIFGTDLENLVMALIRYVNEINAKDHKSMYAVLKPMEIKEFAEIAVKRFKVIGGHF